MPATAAMDEGCGGVIDIDRTAGYEAEADELGNADATGTVAKDAAAVVLFWNVVFAVTLVVIAGVDLCAVTAGMVVLCVLLLSTIGVLLKIVG
jgi:hypothetical protein